MASKKVSQRIQPLQGPCPVGSLTCVYGEKWAEIKYILALMFLIQISSSQQGAQILTEGLQSLLKT